MRLNPKSVLKTVLKFVGPQRPLKQVLEDDALFELMSIPIIVCRHKFWRPLGLFLFAFILFMYGGGLIFIAATNQWHLFFTQYSALGFGGTMAVSAYLTSFLKLEDFDKIYHSTFPNLWPLHSVNKRTFDNIQRKCKLMKLGSAFSFVMCMLSAILALPWFGDEYNVYFPIKMFVDLFHPYELPFNVLFYMEIFHGSITLLVSVNGLAYLALHLHIQCYLLNQRLEEFNNFEHVDLVNIFKDDEYQNEISRQLVYCLKHHQNLLKFESDINNLIYYPIFYFSMCGIGSILGIILIPKNTFSIISRVFFIAIVAIFMALLFCSVGQLVESESERIFSSTASTPWYLWNSKNRKHIQMMLLKTQSNMVLSSSGIVTINFELLIRLYQTVYSTATFMQNIPTQRVN